MLDLFIRLMDKLIVLAKEWQREKRLLHDDFILPLMQQFEIVHKEYISSFMSYRDLINTEAPNFTNKNPVFNKLDADMIFTHSSRDKLFSMSKNIDLLRNPNHADKMYEEDNKIGIFILHVHWYVAAISDSFLRNFNAPRMSLVETLSKIASGNRDHKGMSPSQEAEKEVSEKMWEMQDMYSEIQDAYQEARVELLK